jgi:ABC-type multidrug transport system fused ATPase/permease subunit
MCVENGAGNETHSRSGRAWSVAVGLLNPRTRLVFALLTGGRILVGMCDLLVAAAMYLLFLLLQGHATTVRFRGNPPTILSVGLITAALVIARTGMDLATARLAFRQIQNLGSNLLLRLVQGYNEMRWNRFVERNRSEIVHHAIHTAREAADFYHRWIELASAAAIVAVMTVAIVYQNPLAACGFSALLAAVWGLHQGTIRSGLRQAASSREDSLRRLQRNLADMFSSGKEMRAYSLHSFFYDRIRRQAQRLAAASTRAVFLPQIARAVADQGAVLLFLALMIAVQLRQGDTRRLLALLAFYFVLSRRLLPLISQMSFVAGQMEASYENVRMVASELEEIEHHRRPKMPVDLPGAGWALELRRISFWFDGAAPILQDVDLRIRKGEVVVLQGASGIGKSSLLNLVAGVSEPRSGTVRVDRTGIAYVPQEVPLLDDSIRNNLLFGLTGKSDEDLMMALSCSRLDAFVAAQLHGLDTAVGDNGALLSGGQRQRLGLARALLRGANLLLLDEATSALDEESEEQILEMLCASGKTVLLVTHRARARRFAHRVLSFQAGQLVEESAAPEACLTA